MGQIKRGLCGKCKARVPAELDFRDGKVFLRKNCPDCGATESLVSNDIEAWQRKRDIWHYQPQAAQSQCSMQCKQCRISHDPTIVFIDVTNRCNMNCPICIANIRGMGFEFHPPMEYFEKIFRTIGQFRPIPIVELFGGEPTLRDDLLEIIKLARHYRVKARVVTNGLRLADDEYCKVFCGEGVRFHLAFDGRAPEIYGRLRNNPAVYEKKMKALANLKKYSRRKNAILCCAARKINEQHIGDLIECCHEHMDVIDSLGLIPLTENWEAGKFETDVQTTREDVEHMVETSVPGNKVEFIPAGIMHSLRKARAFINADARSDSLMLGGVHPDCETMTLLVSDGQNYVSINNYLKMPLSKVAGEILARARGIDARLSALNPAKFLDRWRGRLLALKTYAPLALRAISLRRVFRGNPLVVLLKMLGELIRLHRPGDVARRHLNLAIMLRVGIFPFEEYHSLDSDKLACCKAVFAYEDVDTGQIKTIPACAWNTYRNDLLHRIADKYGIKPASEAEYSQTPAPVQA